MALLGRTYTPTLYFPPICIYACEQNTCVRSESGSGNYKARHRSVCVSENGDILLPNLSQSVNTTVWSGGWMGGLCAKQYGFSAGGSKWIPEKQEGGTHRLDTYRNYGFNFLLENTSGTMARACGCGLMLYVTQAFES